MVFLYECKHIIQTQAEKCPYFEKGPMRSQFSKGGKTLKYFLNETVYTESFFSDYISLLKIFLGPLFHTSAFYIDF
jgi:hypothetical protein